MPKPFQDCVKAGGKVRTRHINAINYQHICVRPNGEKGTKGGTTVAGEVKTIKKPAGK